MLQSHPKDRRSTAGWPALVVLCFCFGLRGSNCAHPNPRNVSLFDSDAILEPWKHPNQFAVQDVEPFVLVFSGSDRRAVLEQRQTSQNADIQDVTTLADGPPRKSIDASSRSPEPRATRWGVRAHVPILHAQNTVLLEIDGDRVLFDSDIIVGTFYTEGNSSKVRLHPWVLQSKSATRTPHRALGSTIDPQDELLKWVDGIVRDLPFDNTRSFLLCHCARVPHNTCCLFTSRSRSHLRSMIHAANNLFL